MERYHELADATMDTMLESLEALLDDLAEEAFEVDYSVSFSFFLSLPSVSVLD